MPRCAQADWDEQNGIKTHWAGDDRLRMLPLVGSEARLHQRLCRRNRWHRTAVHAVKRKTPRQLLANPAVVLRGRTVSYLLGDLRANRSVKALLGSWRMERPLASQHWLSKGESRL